VLIHPRLQFVGLELNLVAVEGHTAHQNRLRTHDLDKETRNRQAALVVHPFAVGFDDFGVAHHVALTIEVPDEHLTAHPDLRGSERDSTIGTVERVEHLIDQTNNPAIDVGHRCRSGLQHRVTECANFLAHAWQASDMAAQYFAERPSSQSRPTDVDVNVRSVSFAYRTDSGVFSHGHLDRGTSLLLHTAPDPPPTGTFCDLGCGAGPIAVTLGLLAPSATVWALDVNERARELTARNAATAGATGVRVSAPDEVPDDVRFDLMWSNPPVRIGKAEMRNLLTTWLDRLTPTGRAVMVVNRHLGADSLQRWLIEQGYPCDRITSRSGFRVLAIDAGHEPRAGSTATRSR